MIRDRHRGRARPGDDQGAPGGQTGAGRVPDSMDVDPTVVHTLPGRLRVHLPGWSGVDRAPVEAYLAHLPGVCSARATPMTGNVLITDDPRVTDAPTLLMMLCATQRARRRVGAAGLTRGPADGRLG